MSTPNVQVILQAILSATDNLQSPPPYNSQYDFGNPTLNGTVYDMFSYLQATVGGVAVSLPASKVFLVGIKNLHASQLLNVSMTPFGGSAFNFSIGAGGTILIMDPLKTGTGFSALTLTGVGGTTPAFVMVGA